MGWLKFVCVGEWPDEARRKLYLSHSEIWLSRDSLFHILFDHRDITPNRLLLLPNIISRGVLIQENRKRHVIMAQYFHEPTRERYVAVLKVTNNKAETWVSSVYRIRERHIRALLQRGIVLKKHDHDWE